jgi:hypothetical protein
MVKFWQLWIKFITKNPEPHKFSNFTGYSAWVLYTNFTSCGGSKRNKVKRCKV